MTQPERPDRAAAEQLRQDRVAAQLRYAAHSYEPDGERIRRLVDTRAAATGGTPIKTGQTRGLGGRTVMWPVLGSAAAAAVILAVAASGAPESPPQSVVVGVSGEGGSPTAGGSTLLDPTSTKVPVKPPVVSGHGATGHGTTTVPGTSDGSTAGKPGPGGAGAGAPAGPGAHDASASTSGTVAGRSVTAVVRPVSGTRQVSLGGPGQVWALAGTSTSSSTAAAANPTGVGPIQGQAPGAVSEPGPFTVRWQNGTPQPSGTTSSWLVVPAAAPGQALAQVPVRFKADAFTVVLYVGTFGGSGRLEVGNGSATLRVLLPDCGGSTCASVVTITSHGGPGLPTTGDLPVHVYAEGADRIAIAAASLD